MKNTGKARILVLLLAAVLTACGQKADEPITNNAQSNQATSVTEQSNQTADAAENNVNATEPSEADEKEETPVVEEPEAEATLEDLNESSLPVQGDVPCDFSDTIDLSSDFKTTQLTLEDGGGSWILGDDGTQMQNPLTEDLMHEYKYFAITYECDDCDEASEIALMCKFVHEDGTKTEFLCSNWYAFGPAGMTYMSSSFQTMNAYGEEGVFYVPTEAILTQEHFREGDIVNQIGLCAVEGTGTWINLTITGAYLTK